MSSLPQPSERSHRSFHSSEDVLGLTLYHDLQMHLQCRSLCMRVNQAKPDTTVNPDHERVVRCLCNWCNSLSPSSGDGICEEDLQILTCQAAAHVPMCC